MGHVYFASDSLACVRDTRRLALETGWIWRETYAGIGTLAPVAGAQILLAFSRGGRFVPLALCDLMPAGNEEVGFGNRDAIGRIPDQEVLEFLEAGPGQGGAGYAKEDNSGLSGIHVWVREHCDAIWAGVEDAHEIPEGHLYGWSGATRPALQAFDSGALVDPVLPRGFWPK